MSLELIVTEHDGDYGVLEDVVHRAEPDAHTSAADMAEWDAMASMVTARVITAAALIMVFVFASFVLEDMRTVKVLDSDDDAVERIHRL